MAFVEFNIQTLFLGIFCSFLIAICATAIGFHLFHIMLGVFNPRMPPLSPSNLFANTFTLGYKKLLLYYNQSLWCESNTNQNTAHGTIFRIWNPKWIPFVVCCDYKFARLVLAGTDDNKIRESEKTLMIQGLNSIKGVCNLLT